MQLAKKNFVTQEILPNDKPENFQSAQNPGWQNFTLEAMNIQPLFVFAKKQIVITWSSIGMLIQKIIQDIATTIPLGIKTCNKGFTNLACWVLKLGGKCGVFVRNSMKAV